MKHEHASGVDCPACKKWFNNEPIIATLASEFNTPEAAALAKAALRFGKIADGLGIEKPPIEEFHGCEQGMLLFDWLMSGEAPDPEKMKQWTAEIVTATQAMIAGNLK